MTDPNQWSADNRMIQEDMWHLRSLYLDILLLHDCGAEKSARALLRHVAWDPEEFIEAALADRKDLLHFTEVG